MEGCVVVMGPLNVLNPLEPFYVRMYARICSPESVTAINAELCVLQVILFSSSENRIYFLLLIWVPVAAFVSV